MTFNAALASPCPAGSFSMRNWQGVVFRCLLLYAALAILPCLQYVEKLDSILKAKLDGIMELKNKLDRWVGAGGPGISGS
jgi:hypothetical protein